MNSKYKLFILKIGFSELGYEQEKAWDILCKTDLDQNIAIIHEQDIESYNWQKQEIKLTIQGSENIKKVAKVDEDRFESAFYQNAFVVTMDQKRLYGGIFLMPYSAMGISYPVIHPHIENGKIFLHIRPTMVYGQSDVIDLHSFKDIKEYFFKKEKIIELK